MSFCISMQGLCCYTGIQWAKFSIGLSEQNIIEINRTAHIYNERQFRPVNAMCKCSQLQSIRTCVAAFKKELIHMDFVIVTFNFCG